MKGFAHVRITNVRHDLSSVERRSRRVITSHHGRMWVCMYECISDRRWRRVRRSRGSSLNCHNWFNCLCGDDLLVSGAGEADELVFWLDQWRHRGKKFNLPTLADQLYLVERIWGRLNYASRGGWKNEKSSEHDSNDSIWPVIKQWWNMVVVNMSNRRRLHDMCQVLQYC